MCKEDSLHCTDVFFLLYTIYMYEHRHTLLKLITMFGNEDDILYRGIHIENYIY